MRKRNSGDFIYDYAHSFFGDGSYPMHYTVIMVSTFFRSFWNLMELFMDYIYILPNIYTYVYLKLTRFYNCLLNDQCATLVASVSEKNIPNGS